MIEMDKSEYLDSDFSDESLRRIAAFCGWKTAHSLLLPPPVPIQPRAGVRFRACMTRFWKLLIHFGKTACR